MSRARDTERLRAAFASLAESSRGGSECPDPARIWAASRGELDPGGVRALLDHARSCGACGDAWRLAREVSGGSSDVARGSAEGTARTRRPRHWWGAGGLAAAAIAILALVIPLLVSPPEDVGAARMRSDEPAVVETLVPEEIPLRRADALLRWTAGPEGATYDVEVVNEELEPLLAREGLETNELRIPAEALDRLAPGARLLWRVETVLQDGTRSGSRTFIHRLE